MLKMSVRVRKRVVITQDEQLAEHFERPVPESSAKMTLPLIGFSIELTAFPVASVLS